MPMKRRALHRTSNLVDHGNLDGIAPISLDRRSRKLSVDQDHISLDTIRSHDAALKNEVVASDNACVGRVCVWIGVASCA